MGVEKVDQLINLVGELVITQAMLAETTSAFDPALHDGFFNGMAQLERNARDLARGHHVHPHDANGLRIQSLPAPRA